MNHIIDTSLKAVNPFSFNIDETLDEIIAENQVNKGPRRKAILSKDKQYQTQKDNTFMNLQIVSNPSLTMRFKDYFQLPTWVKEMYYISGKTKFNLLCLAERY